MCTVKLSYDQKNAKAREMLATILASGLFFVNETPDNKKYRVYVENGEVKWDIYAETMSIEETREMLHKVVDLEYSLP